MQIKSIKETGLMKRLKDRISWDKRISNADVHVSFSGRQVMSLVK